MHCMFTMGCGSRGTHPHVGTHTNGCQQCVVDVSGREGSGTVIAALRGLLLSSHTGGRSFNLQAEEFSNLLGVGTITRARRLQWAL